MFRPSSFSRKHSPIHFLFLVGFDPVGRFRPTSVCAAFSDLCCRCVLRGTQFGLVGRLMQAIFSNFLFLRRSSFDYYVTHCGLLNPSSCVPSFQCFHNSFFTHFLFDCMFSSHQGGPPGTFGFLKIIRYAPHRTKNGSSQVP